MTSQLLAGLTPGRVIAYIGFALLFIISLCQLLSAVSQQSNKGIRENIVCLLFSVCAFGSIYAESIKPLKLLSEVLALAGFFLGCSLFYVSVMAKKRVIVGDQTAASPSAPTDEVWPPPPTAPGGGQL